MSFLDDLLRPAVNTYNTVKGAAANIPQELNGGRVGLGQVIRKTPAALETVGIPLVKAAADATGTIGSWSPIKPVSNFWKNQKLQTDQSLNDWATQAHKDLGISGNDNLVKSAELIPKGISQAVQLEAGGALGGKLAGLFGHLAQAGLSKEGFGLLADVAHQNPGMATTLAKYVTNPNTDTNLFKAAWDLAKNGKNVDPASLFRLARGTGAAVGGSTGYNTLAGAEQGKSGGQTAKTVAEGIPMGYPIEGGIDTGKFVGKVGIKLAQDGAHATGELVPKVAAFLHNALNSTNPEVKAKMQDLTEHFVSDVHTPEAPTPIVHEPGTPLSEMNPSMMNAHQQAKAQQDHNLIQANRLVQKQQAVADQQAQEAAARRGGLQPLNVDAEAKVAQLRARQQANTEKRWGATQPSSQEQAIADRNAAEEQAALQQQAKPIEAPKPAEKPMLENQTGSAQENQTGDTKPVVTGKQQGDQIVTDLLNKKSAKANPDGLPKEETTTPPKEQALGPSIKREYNADGSFKRLINGRTGEVFTESHDGSPLSLLKNELLHERDGEAYGTNGGDIQGVHEGQAKTLAHRVEDAVRHINDSLTPDEREQLTHYAEGSLKASEINPKVKELGDQWKEIERIGYLLNKEASRTTGEIDNSAVSHVEHINLDKTSRGKVGIGRFSTKNSTQQGRTIVKLTGVKGKTKFGDPEAMGMHKQANGNYVDKFGNTWHASQATIKELNENGHKYEADAGKIMASSFNKYAKTANNLKLGRNLNGRGHGEAVIPRNGATVPPKGYHESHIPGLEDKWISNQYHRYLYTASDAQHGAVYNGVKLVGKYVMKPVTAPLNKLFFAENSLYHQVVNEIGQSFTTAGAGNGTGSKLAAPLKVFGNLGRTGKELGKANLAVQRHSEVWYDAVRNGLHVSEHSSGGRDKLMGGVMTKLRNFGHAVDLTGKLGTSAAKHIGDTIRLAKYQELTAGGMSGREAARLINQLQGNYERMTQFEKEIVSNYVQFYPFFKHQVTSIAHTGVGAFKNPSLYAGSAVAAAMTYAGYAAIDKALQGVTGNKYAKVTKGGMLGLVDDVIKARGQIKGYTDASGKKHPGTVPSIATKRLTPLEKGIIEQSTGKDLATNTKFDTSTKGHLAQAGKSVTPVAQGQDISSGRRSIGEKVANINGVYLPHGAHTAAAPKLAKTPLNGLINVEGMNSKQTVDNANKAADLGGSKLASYQYARINGDNSLQSFWDKNPTLDPLSSQFKGFSSGASSKVTLNGDKAFKAAGGSSLSYMQAMKASGNTTYDKFFAAHPNLDPTSSSFQGMKTSSSSSKSGELNYVKSVGKSAVNRAKGLKTPVSLKRAHSSVPGMKKTYSTHPKTTKLKLATSKAPTAPKTAHVVTAKSLISKANKPPTVKKAKAKLA